MNRAVYGMIVGAEDVDGTEVGEVVGGKDGSTEGIYDGMAVGEVG